MSDSLLPDKLLELIDEWERYARCAFLSAEKQKDDPNHRPTGKRFIDHGAMCYLNCATELKEVLVSAGLLPSTTQEADQK